MEELQSTEILDREILEDARKKAYRILKAADETVKAKAAEWEQKTAGTLDEAHKKYAARREFVSREIMARLPLDKQRAKAELFESLLRSAVNDWYGALSRERVLSVLKGELARRIAVCGELSAPGEQPQVLIHKLKQAEAEEILKAVLPGAGCLVTEISAPYPYPEIILENSRVRISASINKTVDFLLQEKRAELLISLLGKEAL